MSRTRSERLRSKDEASSEPVLYREDFPGSEMGSKARLKSRRQREDLGEQEWCLTRSIIRDSDSRSSSREISKPCFIR